jgi:diguanylate cyclase (GGDEF)-like protein
MTVEPTKLSSCSRGLRETSKSASPSVDAGLLTMTSDLQLLRGNASRVLHDRRKKTAASVFQALLSEANRELSRLLKDVRAAQEDARPGETPGSSINQLLERALQCAEKQYMVQSELGHLALTDELTGVYNRRGFMAIAERQLKVGQRSGRGMLLFFIDVDALKQINDSFGHCEGDCALQRTARALESTFRDSDVIARLGGDEFAVLAIEAADHSEASIRARLCDDLKSLGAGEPRYAISLSLGVARFDPRDRASIGDLIVEADRSMYEEKRRRLQARTATRANYYSP